MNITQLSHSVSTSKSSTDPIDDEIRYLLGGLLSAKETDLLVALEQDREALEEHRMRQLCDKIQMAICFLLGGAVPASKDIERITRLYSQCLRLIPRRFQIASLWFASNHCTGITCFVPSLAENLVHSWLGQSNPCALLVLSSIPSSWNDFEELIPFPAQVAFFFAENGLNFLAKESRKTFLLIAASNEFSINKVVEKLKLAYSPKTPIESSRVLLEKLAQPELDVLKAYSNFSPFISELTAHVNKLEEKCTSVLLNKFTLMNYDCDFPAYLKLKLSNYFRLFLESDGGKLEANADIWEADRKLLKKIWDAFSVEFCGNNRLLESDFKQLQQLLTRHKTVFSTTTYINLENILEKFASHDKNRFCYGYDFDHFVERLDHILDNSALTAPLSWDFIDDLSNVFNYGYSIPWKNSADPNIVLEAGGDASEKAQQVYQDHLKRLLEMLASSSNSLEFLEFYANLDHYCRVLQSQFKYDPALQLVLKILERPEIQERSRSGWFLKPKLLQLKQEIAQNMLDYQCYMHAHYDSSGDSASFPTHIMKYWIDKKLELEELRRIFQDCKPRIDPVAFAKQQKLFNEGIVKFTLELINNAIMIIGAPPVPELFALFVFGSLSRQDALSYSDIEYGLLRETNLPANHFYFNQLMILFHVQIGKSDGYRIDSGGHPLTLLCDGVNRFHGRVSDFTKFLATSQTSSLGGKENNSLLNSWLIYGSSQLLAEFKKQVKLTLDKKFEDSEELSGFSVRQARSLLHLQAFTKIFKNSDGTIKSLKDVSPSGKLDLKASVVEPLKYWICDFASFHGIDGFSPHECINFLREANILEKSFSYYLFHVLACLENIRNRVHLHFGRQEKKEVVFIPQFSEAKEEVKDTYVLSEELAIQPLYLSFQILADKSFLRLPFNPFDVLKGVIDKSLVKKQKQQVKEVASKLNKSRLLAVISEYLPSSPSMGEQNTTDATTTAVTILTTQSEMKYPDHLVECKNYLSSFRESLGMSSLHNNSSQGEQVDVVVVMDAASHCPIPSHLNLYFEGMNEKFAPWRPQPSLLSNHSALRSKEYDEYSLLPSDSCYEFVMTYFSHDAPLNFKVSKISMIVNQKLQKNFEKELSQMEAEASSFSSKPSWPADNLASDREKALLRWKNYNIFPPPQISSRSLNHCVVIPLWYGASSATDCAAICANGFKGGSSHAKRMKKTLFQLNDPSGASGSNSSEYGSGIYLSNSSRHASIQCSDNYLMLCFVCLREPFPVVVKTNQDSSMLKGKGSFQTYNAHYIPGVGVIGGINNNLSKSSPVTSVSNNADEIVVFQSAQVLPAYVIVLRSLSESLQKSLNDYSFENCFQACKQGFILEVQRWLTSDPERLKATDRQGQSFVFAAILGNQIEILEWLYFQLPELVTMPRSDGLAPIHLACYAGNLEIARWIVAVLEATTSATNAPSCFTVKSKEGFTPLHLAAQNEQMEILEAFKSLIPPDLILYLATSACLRSFTFLLSFADVTVRYSNKRTILHLAAELGLEANVLAILNHTQAPSENEEKRTSSNNLPTASLLQIIDAVDARQHTALYIAVSQGHRSIVHALLNAGANPALCASDGSNPLHQAAFWGRGLILQDLLTFTNCRALVNSCDDDGKTPLHKLCWNEFDCVDSVKLLVEAGADVNAENKYQYTALHWSVKHALFNITSYLLKRDNIKDNIRNINNDAPIDLAIKGRNARMVFFLLTGRDCGDVEIKGNEKKFWESSLSDASTNGVTENQIIALCFLSDISKDSSDFEKSAVMINIAIGLLENGRKSDGRSYENFLLFLARKLHNLEEEALFQRSGNKIPRDRSEDSFRQFRSVRDELFAIRNGPANLTPSSTQPKPNNNAKPTLVSQNSISSELANISAQFRSLLTALIEERIRFIGGLPESFDNWFIFTSGPIATNECLPYSSFPLFLIYSLPSSGGLFGSSLDPAILKQINNSLETLKKMLAMRLISAGIELSVIALHALSSLKISGDVIHVESLSSCLQKLKSPWTEKFPLPFLPRDIMFLAGKRTAFTSFVKQLVSEVDSRSSGLFSTKKYELMGLDTIKCSIQLFEVENKSFANQSTLSLDSLFNSFHGIIKGLYLYFFARSEFLNVGLLMDLFLEKKIFPKGLAEKVKESFQSLFTLRLSCHQFYRGFCEVVCVGDEKESALPRKSGCVACVLSLDQPQAAMLANILTVISLLVDKSKVFLKSKEASAFLQYT